jgi:hypothetical protein
MILQVSVGAGIVGTGALCAHIIQVPPPTLENLFPKVIKQQQHTKEQQFVSCFN